MDWTEHFPSGHPKTGWFVIGTLLFLASVVWFHATPLYVKYFFGRYQAHELPEGFVRNGTVPGREPGEMAMVFFDVGYGDGILVQAPDGTTSLIDGGEGKYPETNPAYARDLAYRLYLPFFRATGRFEFENFISTVPYSHHMGVQADLLSLERIDVENVFWTGYGARFEAHRRFRIHAKREGDLRVLREGASPDLGGGIKSRVIYARSDVKVRERTSRVLLVKYGSTKFLLLSDLPREGEKNLVLDWGRGLQSDLVKLGSHGSNDSNSRKLLDFVRPNYAVISVSRENPLGAPGKTVLRTLEQTGVRKVFRTREHGHIAVYSDGSSLRFETNAFSFL